MVTVININIFLFVRLNELGIPLQIIFYCSSFILNMAMNCSLVHELHALWCMNYMLSVGHLGDPSQLFNKLSCVTVMPFPMTELDF